VAEMIDRVAAAILKAAHMNGMPIDDSGPLARAAIEAMREPTEAMKDAYYKFDERFSSYPAQDCWETMLDEALK
jgi:hypothetical protein